MKRFLSTGLRYPKMMLLLVSFAFAYIIFAGNDFLHFHEFFSSLGYLGMFLLGMGFSYGFTTPPVTAILLLTAKSQDILISGLIGGFGALLSDLLIFHLIRYSFADEIKRLSETRLVTYIDKKTPYRLDRYLLPVLAEFVIASPLPDEIGVSLLAATRHVSRKVFSVFSYVMSTIGIFIILIVGSII